MIEPKQKPCKGMNKAKGVPGCGTPIYRTLKNHGLCADCLGEWLFGTTAGKELMAKSVLPKAKAIVKTEKRKADTEKRNELGGIPRKKKLLEKEINKICCLIDRRAGCISCPSHNTPQAGHYHTVASNGALRYNLHNLHLQDYNCNVGRSANIPAYDLGLIDRYGKPYWEYVKFDIVRETPELKLKEWEYDEYIDRARKIVKDFGKLVDSRTEPFTPQQRIQLRTKYNKIIGLYAN